MKTLLLIFFCLFCLLNLIFGKYLAPQGRISGGEIAMYGSVPYVVSLQDSNGQHFCGESIIASTWVLSTAGGITGLPRDSLRVSTGSMDIAIPGTLYSVKRIIIHPFFAVLDRYTNDIGLLELQYFIVFNSFKQPIAMAEENNLKEGDELMITGWGAQDVHFPHVLRSGKVNYIANEKCKDLVGSQSRISDGNICTDASKGVSPHRGDAGGPVTDKNNRLVGIIIWNHPNGVSGHVNVAHYWNWIYGKINRRQG